MCDVCRKMAAAGSPLPAVGAAGPDSPGWVTAGQAEPGAVAPWEQIATGRYMPRRTRGSFPGRELGWAFVVPPGSGGESSKGKP